MVVHAKEELKLGRKLRIAREKRGLTERQLADIVGVPVQQIHIFEEGRSRIPATILFKVAELCNVPLEKFSSEVELSNVEILSTGVREQFDKIADPHTKRTLRELIYVLAAEE